MISAMVFIAFLAATIYLFIRMIEPATKHYVVYDNRWGEPVRAFRTYHMAERWSKRTGTHTYVRYKK